MRMTTTMLLIEISCGGQHAGICMFLMHAACKNLDGSSLTPKTEAAKMGQGFLIGKKTSRGVGFSDYITIQLRYVPI